MDELTIKRIKRDISFYRAIIISSIVYISGILYINYNQRFQLEQEIRGLSYKKIRLEQNIEDNKRHIPLMQEKFAYAYHDSLDAKIDSLEKINLKIGKLEQESEKVNKKIPFSWVYYILK